MAEAESFTVAEGATCHHRHRCLDCTWPACWTTTRTRCRRHADRSTPHRSPTSVNGTLTLNADGTFSYTHDGSENFTDSFTYESPIRGTDQRPRSSDHDHPVNDSTPVADAESFTVAEGGYRHTARWAGPRQCAGQRHGPRRRRRVRSTPHRWRCINGTLTLNADGTFSYTHDGSENFTDSFTYRVTDNDGQTSDATVTITSRRSATRPRSPWPIASRSLKAAPRHHPADVLDATLPACWQRHRPADVAGAGQHRHRSSSRNGSLTLNADGTFSYTHDGSENFTDSFTYRVTDNDGQTTARPRSRSRSHRSTTTRRWPMTESFTVAEGGTATPTWTVRSHLLACWTTTPTCRRHPDGQHHTGRSMPSLRHPDAERRRHVQLHARRQRELHRQLHLRVSDDDGPHRTRPRSRSPSPRSTTTPRWPRPRAITVAEGGTATSAGRAATQSAGQRHGRRPAERHADRGQHRSPVLSRDGTLTLNADGTSATRTTAARTSPTASPTRSPTTTDRPATPPSRSRHPGQRQHPGGRHRELHGRRRRHGTPLDERRDRCQRAGQRHRPGRRRRLTVSTDTGR